MYSGIYLKVEVYETENKTHVATNINERKWQQPRLPHTLFQSVQISLNAKLTECFDFFILQHDGTFFCVRCMCPSCFMLISYDTVKDVPYIHESFIRALTFSLLCQISKVGGGGGGGGGGGQGVHLKSRNAL